MRVERWCGTAAAVAGAAWVAGCLVQNTLPEGCIGDACDTHPMRGDSTLANVLLGTALILLAVAGTGLLALAGPTARATRLARTALGATAVGVLLLVAAGVVSSVDNTWNGMPALVIPGIVLLALGLVLIGFVVLASGVLPVWAAVLLVVTTAVLPFGNFETTPRTWMFVPFGLAWLVAGVLLLVSAPSEDRRSPAAPPPQPDPTTG